MPFVKTYGKHRTGVVKSHSWLSPDVVDGNVFSSPEVEPEPTFAVSPPEPSIEKRRNAGIGVNDKVATKQGKRRRAKPKTFAAFFSQSDETDDDKENFIPAKAPLRKSHQSRNIWEPRNSVTEIDEANITHRRNKSSSSSNQSGSSQPSGTKRRLSKLSRGSRRLRQDNGALCELGKKSSSSSSSSSTTSSSWQPSNVSTRSTTSLGDRSCDLFNISEAVGSLEESCDEEIKTGTPEAKRAKSVRDKRSKYKEEGKRGRQILNGPQGKDTSTPVSVYHSAYGSKDFSAVLFDTTTSPSIVDGIPIDSGALRDSVFEEDISRNVDRLNIEDDSDLSPFETCHGEFATSRDGLSQNSVRSQRSLRSSTRTDPAVALMGEQSLVTDSKRGSKRDRIIATYTVVSDSEADSDVSIDTETNKGIESPETDPNSERSSRGKRGEKVTKSGPVERDRREERELKVKISPCNIILEKLPLSQLHTPPKNKQTSRLMEEGNRSFRDSLTPSRDRKSGHVITARSKVLGHCQQTEPLPFSEILSEREMSKCVKVGEGAYGEVFLTTNEKRESIALKIIPVEGDFRVNGEPQKTFEEILPEIVISKELSSMHTNCVNQTTNFIQVNRVACIQGKYPEFLLQQWDAYHEKKGSENDRPDLFDENQLFILFEFANGGTDLEDFEFANIREAVSILRQVAGALASAECQYCFEHRDLHWGNVLVRKSKRSKVSFKVEGDVFDVSSFRVEASIIDFTLSRLSKDGCTVFCDVANDETLFIGKGDYQFDIYRKMKKENKNDWESFNPHSNVLWLHYLLEKMIRNKTYRSAPSKESMRELKTFGRHLLGYTSAEEVLRESELLQLLEEA
ncbi:putative serine/threonine-protein kinase haspin [Apostichopus japonicus]|uniref:non-specific serine/threonine protein kinase n=1 Tax=Stichopus japonicus TaxID=307972 RepID=A0A2G8JNG6_STIJA|nr:putative serine/threonine-protein kinase haspin [Apostichopus japonicus]